ncbi:MAG: hypothetical protein WBK91_00525 [Alphaproteobacteria bacterium]
MTAGVETTVPETFASYSARPISAEIVYFMAQPMVVPELADHGYSALVLERLERMTDHGRAPILSAPGAVQSLLRHGHGEKLVALIGDTTWEHQTRILSAPGVVYALALNGHADEVMNLIGKLLPEQKASVLAAPDSLLGVCVCHPDEKVRSARAARIMDWIDIMPEAAQEKVLAARYNASMLAFKGVAQRLVARIGTLDFSKQEKILADGENVNGLAANGQKEEVTRLQSGIKEWRAARMVTPT